jgi:putative ABC transport system permease protein
MAWANVTREKRKFAITVLSLSLALILLNSAFSAARSFDMDAYLSGSIISDFAVAGHGIFNSALESDTSGVTANFLSEAQSRGGEISNIYYHGEAAAQVYGISETALVYFSDVFDTDYEKLSSGNYAIVSRYIFTYGDNPVNLPEVGNTLTITNDNGVTRDFEVVGLIDAYPSQISTGFRFGNSLDVIVTDNVFLDFFGEVGPMRTNINVRADSIAEYESWLASYTTNQNPDLGFVSRNTLISEFDSLATTYLMLGSSMSLILALVGVLNFVNAIAASVIARRRELAMLQSVGMTGKQLRHTLFFEGGCHAVLSLCFTLTVGAALGLMIVRVIAGQLWFFKQSFTVMPSVICAIPLLIVCVIAPLVCYKRLTRESLVQRLRVE